MRAIVTVGLGLGLAVWAAAQDEKVDPRKADVVNRLNTQRVTLDFKEAALDDVVNFLREFTGLNFHIDADVRSKLSEDQLRITFKARDLVLKSALKLMLSARELTLVYREGVLVIEHRDKTVQSTALQVYDVRDLLFKLQDFPGPVMELDVDKSGIKPFNFGGADFEPKGVIDENFLVDIIKSTTGDRNWDENPKASVTLMNGLLVVSQSGKVQEEIRRLLNLLRQYK